MHQQIFKFIILPFVLGCFALSPKVRAADETTSNANTGEGTSALNSNTTGVGNTALGFEALFSNTTGNFNTATGVGALASTSSDTRNTATGAGALFFNNGGTSNTAVGIVALLNNTSASNNTAVGDSALFSNTSGNGNVAVGFQALSSNTVVGTQTDDGSNVAIGFQALENENGTGSSSGGANNGIGQQALQDCTTGFWNNALGAFSLQVVTTGSENTAIGDAAGDSITSGSLNIAVGSDAGSNLTTGSNNIDIYDTGESFDSNTIRIGTQGTQTKTFIAGISGVMEGGTISVVTINTSGQLGTESAVLAPAVVSSRRFKDQIKPMDKASEAILALKPVTFRYKKEQDPKGIPQFGLVAEDVEKVNSDLITRDKEGKPYTVRYDAVNAMLLNELLKEHRKVQELKSAAAKQEASIAQLNSTVTQEQRAFQTTIAKQQKQIEALTAGLQKVTAQVEMSKPAPQTVVNNQ